MAETTKVVYRATAFIAGRQGTQVEESGSKRESIRMAKRLMDGKPFGSAVSVSAISTTGEKRKESLIFQAHVAKRRDGSLYTRSDEL